jgi:hypothetical protein
MTISSHTSDIFLHADAESHQEAEDQDLHTKYDRILDRRQVEALQAYSFQQQRK